MEIFYKWIIYSLRKLGILGTICFVGSVSLFIGATQVDFLKNSGKGWALISIGGILILFSGVIYHLETREITKKFEAAVKTLGEVYNRLSEQSAKVDIDKLSGILEKIDKFPEKISELLKKKY